MQFRLYVFAAADLVTVWPAAVMTHVKVKILGIKIQGLVPADPVSVDI